MVKFISVILILFLNGFLALAQQKPVEQLTREDIMTMSFDELSAYSMEDQMKLASIAGVSFEELFNLELNKDVSIASKQTESFFDTPLSTSVLTAEEIERSGVLSVPEAMRLIPGVMVFEKTNGNYGVQLRSNNNVEGQQNLFAENTLTLVMLDGRIVHNYITGGMFWETLPVSISEVERIEVIRGAASVMYGANAVNGVINIITKKSSSEKVSVEAGAKSGNYFNSSNPFAMRTVNNQYLSALVNVNENLILKASVNYNYRERRQSDIYFYLTQNVQFEDRLSNAFYPVDSVIMHGADSKEMYTNPSSGQQAYGINAMAGYTVNDKIDFLLTTGVQRSQVISSNLDLYFFAHTERDMQTQYVNLRSKIYDFDIQTNYTWGNGNLARGIPFFQGNWGVFNTDIDYNYQWNNLNINPGIAMSFNTLNGDGNQSYFAGKQSLSTWTPSLRLDYKPCDQLRFIGGVRMAKYKTPDNYVFSWQLVGNYSFTDKSILRAVYSRANRSPFMMDVNSNSSVNVISNRDRIRTTEIFMEGNKNLKLAIVDMFELGYRQKIGKHLLLNVEAFYSELKNLNTAQLTDMKVKIDPSTISLDNVATMPHYLYYQFENIPDVQQQTGITIELGVVANDKLSFRLWGTGQLSYIKKKHMTSELFVDQGNFAPTIPGMAFVLAYSYSAAYNQVINPEEDNKDAAQAAGIKAISKYIVGWDGSQIIMEVTKKDMEDQINQTEYIRTKSHVTPTFYGGGEMNWQILPKLSFCLNAHGFSSYNYANQFLSATVQSKMLLNANIAYKFMDYATLSLAVNNILNATSPEFGFMDKVGTQWYLGFNFKF
ncbi:MAG: TonB-dependent receptor [Bacteroidales bacterium]|nr:TonB-dependent receptor [Bacteroidales bacterium]